MGEQFENQNMEGAAFRNVNLRRTVFNDVNLEGVTIRNANLAGASIDDANIQGLTVFGLPIDELIDAEQDRRDPERRELRIQDHGDPRQVREVMMRLDARRRAFGERLRAASREDLLRRPTGGCWSPIEHVHHLVFAEDLYINRWILGNDEPLCRLGLPPAFLEENSEFDEVGIEKCEDIDAVLAAWDRVHARTREFLKEVTAEQLSRDTSDVDFGQGTVANILQGMAHHDLHHMRRAEAALDETSGDN